LEFGEGKAARLCLYVISDGALSSNGQIDNSAGGRGKGQWTGDSSDQAATFMLVHDPRVAGQRPALTTATANQIGYYRPNGSVETPSSAVANKGAPPPEAAGAHLPALPHP